MKYLITCILILSLSISGYAQRRNKGGFKMVSHVAVRWYMKDGQEFKEMARDVNYHYDDSGKLIGIDDTDHIGSTTFTAKYRLRDDRTVLGRIYRDGTLVKHDSIVLYLFYPFRRVHDYAVGVGEVKYPTHQRDVMSVSWHGNIQICQKDEYLLVEDVTPNNLSEINKAVSDEMESLVKNKYRRHDCSDLYPFESTVVYSFDKDGRMWWRWSNVPGKTSTRYVFIDGDMQNNLSTSLLSNYIKGREDDYFCINEYTERLNDTNIEFYGLCRYYSIGCWSSMPEYSTEWCRTKSLHLPKYMERKYKNGRKYMAEMKENNPAKWEERYGKKPLDCAMKWDYTFDSNDNIVRIDVIAYEWGHNRCVMTVDYVN